MSKPVSSHPLWQRVAVGIGVPALCLAGILILLFRGSPFFCPFYAVTHLYCPGCGGTRAVTALAHGQILRAMYYHLPFVLTAVLAAAYMISQTLWRLRGKQGWVLHYDSRWPGLLAALFLGNSVLRNILWLGFGVGI